MRGKIIENVTLLSKWMLPSVVKEGMVCIDATCGNGHDTLFLSEKVGASGLVYGFDIQALAVDNTRERLKNSPYDNHKIICDSHEHMAQHVTGLVDFIVFNLGYLPKADKAIKTNKTTTMPAVDAALALLKTHGILWLVVYPGHEEGKEEGQVLESYVSDLVQKDYSVLKMAFMNQRNNPPYIIAIEKKC